MGTLAPGLRRHGAVSGCWEGEWISDAAAIRARSDALSAAQDPVVPIAHTPPIIRHLRLVDLLLQLRLRPPHVGGPDDGGWKFRGSAELGCWIAGGLYEYEGRADRESFVASYNSGFDHGVFRMKRVH